LIQCSQSKRHKICCPVYSTRLASITSSFRSNASDIGNHRNHDIDNPKPAVSSQQQHLTAEINQNGEIKEPEVDNTDVNDVFIPIKNE
jgi:hypothetical protein